MLGGRMDCWSSSVDAADAKKAEGASIWALQIPRPPFITGKEAWAHWTSLRSTLRIAGRDALLSAIKLCQQRVVAAVGSPECVQYSSFGIARLFFSSTSASWECSRDRRSTAFLSSSILWLIAASFAVPSRTGDPDSLLYFYFFSFFFLIFCFLLYYCFIVLLL